MPRLHPLPILFAAVFAVLATFSLFSWLNSPDGSSYSSKVFEQKRPLAGLGGLSNTLPGDDYLIGVGKADITGPVVEINFMGYANPSQFGTGLRQRIYSRAFIIGSPSAPSDRVVYLILDTQSGDTAVRAGILDGIAALGQEYAKLYTASNVAVTGTHSHSGPGAWLNYLLPQITSRGLDQQSYQAIVDGAVRSVKEAHESLVSGKIAIGETEVQDANINRSPYAYLANPAEERAQYQHDVDKTMTLLRFTRNSDGKHIGILNWFAVHGTSMLENNTLVTGDNKGVAADLFERSVRGDEFTATGFVAGFSQANVGDTTPNVNGAWCEDGSGMQCRFNDSTCGGKNEPCHGRGPAFRKQDRGAQSCLEIGKRQFQAAKTIYESFSDAKSSALSGKTVRSVHINTEMSNYTFTLSNGTAVTTCPAALGYSFAAGTSDGPGAFDFKQNTTSPNANPLWAVVRNLLHAPDEAQQACHAPKPILLDVGEMTQPYYWTPNIVDVQLFRIGDLVVIISPSEATTMAGRRWRKAIKAQADHLQFTVRQEEGVKVVLGGPANTYAHYVATREEYGVQRYEGASTLYGPFTLEAYIDAYTHALSFLSANNSEPSPVSRLTPPIQTNVSYNFNRGVVFDGTALFKKFGDVAEDVKGGYRIGVGDVVSAKFVGANPRNNLRLGQTYAAVEKLVEDGKWERVRDDADWGLLFEWERTSTILGTSQVTVTWEVEDDTAPGTYRLRYYGDSKAPISGKITAFTATSGEFVLQK